MRADPRETPVSEQSIPVPGPIQPPARPLPGPRPGSETPSETPANPTVTESISLLPEEAASQFRSRWDLIQGGFVDDPRRSVDQAGALVEEALDQLTAVFDEKRASLQRGGAVPTEELRQTLRHYRLLLNRLF